MSKFKVGDYFYIEEQHDYYLKAIAPGIFYKIDEIRERGDYTVLRYIGNNGNKFTVVSCSRLKKRPPIDNKLNRKLYPSYVPEKGYLIPKDKS